LNYQHYNKTLLTFCLKDLETWIDDKKILSHTRTAVSKSISEASINIVPAAVGVLIAEDLQQSKDDLMFLFCACAYFYTAADLLDDIQDKDTQQPVLQEISAEQGMNIVNLLLMGAYQSLYKLSAPPSVQLALVKTFTEMGIQMSAGQFADIASTNHRNPKYSSRDIVRAKAGAELGCFFSCVPCAIGQDPQPYYQLGETVGILLQVFSDYCDIWILPHAEALSEDLLALKHTFPIQAARKDGEWGALIDIELAGKHSDPKKQFRLRRLLSQTHAINEFEVLLNQLKIDFSTCFSALPPLPQIQALIHTYMKQAEQLIAGLKKLKSITKFEVQDHYTPRDKVKSMAIDYLQFIPDFRDVWEVQRWGFLGADVLYGDTFNPLLILEALSHADKSIEAPLRVIVDKKSEYGWHYYSNTRNIPPDTDDLGQLLQLVTHLPPAEHTPIMRPALLNLMNNLEATGRCPTWLCDEERYPRETVNTAWFGDTCVAVMANLYYGLACYDANHYAPQIKRGIDYILQQYDDALPGWQGIHYKSRIYTLYLIARLLQKQKVAFDFEKVTQQLLSVQNLDGSWEQSPQETAFALLFLNTQPQNPAFEAPVLKGHVFVMESQNYDGSWNGEDLFIRPGKNARFEYFSHPKVTTAFCLRAL
jgi:geranylgeranyl pyrophosphate synthase